MKKYYKTKYRQNTFWYILAVFVFVTFLIWYIPSVKSDGQATYKEVTVQPGKYLWDYWLEYGQGEKWQDWVDKTKEINGFKTADVYGGQVIKILEVR